MPEWREPSRQESMTDPAAALQDDDLPAAPPASLDALMPPQIAAKAADIGVAKANADAFSTLVLSVLAGPSSLSERRSRPPRRPAPPGSSRSASRASRSAWCSRSD
jgi:hypothetical protein